MTVTTKKRTGTTALVVLGILFVAATMLSNALLQGARLDLTANRLYTISDGTRNIVAGIDEPINLYFFFSNRATEGVPQLRTYANRVRELLEEFALQADGKVELSIIDPLPFSDEEDRASGFGLQSVTLGNSPDPIFFGLAGTNALDTVEIISFFQPDKEVFLEYDVAKLVHNLVKPEKPVIGLLTSLPMNRGFDPETRQMREPWVISNQIEQLFELRTLEASLDRIPDDIDVLMLVHPKELGADTLYAIDQYVLAGGNALIFVDPHAETDIPAAAAGNPSAAMFASRASDLNSLLRAWGVEIDTASVLADRRFALQISAGFNQPPVRHLALLGFDRSAIADSDIVTADLDSLNVAFSGFIQTAEGTETEVALEALLSSSLEAMPVAAERVRFLPEPASLYDGFQATGTSYVIAARLQGKGRSAYPDGRPAGAEDSAASDTDAPAHIAESTEAINVIVVADTDMLSDRLWVQVQNFFGQRVATAWAGNGNFVINALDNLTGSSDLISIRGRASFVRPFTTVEALQRDADLRFRATEQQLEQELRDTEQKLSELQRNRSDDNPLILSQEQEEELRRFQAAKLDIRKKLRRVRRDLDRDIERLGTTLKIINIALVPVLISLLALALVVLRRRRQEAKGRQ